MYDGPVPHGYEPGTERIERSQLVLVLALSRPGKRRYELYEILTSRGIRSVYTVNLLESTIEI